MLLSLAFTGVCAGWRHVVLSGPAMVVLLLSGGLHCHHFSKGWPSSFDGQCAFHLSSPTGFHCLYMAGIVAG